MRDFLIEITADLYDICNRVREVDERYVLMYNASKKRYEVHVKGRTDSLAIIVEGKPDCRTLLKLRQTHVRRRKEFLREMERYEKAAESDAAYRDRQVIGNACETAMSKIWKSR